MLFIKCIDVIRIVFNKLCGHSFNYIDVMFQLC